MMEGLRLCRALWTGQPVDWDGRWPVHQGVLAPTPFRAGGPPLWIGGNLPTSLERAGKFFDGWFPVAPAADAFGKGLRQVRDIAKAAGRDPAAITGAMYMTIAIDEDAAKAEARLNSFLERYYLQPAAAIQSHQAYYAGPASGVAEYLDNYAQAGAGHLVIRFAGDHENHMTALARARDSLHW
jgi:alkanesulfonate monooxygenase SsuD/methylene tetrahydromethanopterin reductase-like flavin-dependent oxidoreductase (luciferase family)